MGKIEFLNLIALGRNEQQNRIAECSGNSFKVERTRNSNGLNYQFGLNSIDQ
jgi:hypothetical protein